MPGELGNCLAGPRREPLQPARARTSSSTRPARRRWRRWTRRSRAWSSASSTPSSPAASTATWASSTFIKFCAIGALSATGTRPYADGADGFVMGEGAGLFVLKRLADAERDGDRIYAVVRGIGRRRATARARASPRPTRSASSWRSSAPGATPASRPRRARWSRATGRRPASATSSSVNSLGEAFAGAGLAPGSVALGSVKSNIGHLKAAAGAAGMLKTALALHDKVLPPSLELRAARTRTSTGRPSPFAVNTELRDWEVADGATRVAGVSAFGFGGTNFHVVMEEHVPGRLTNGNGHATIAVPVDVPAASRRRHRRAAAAAGRATAAAARRARRSARPTRPGSPTSCARRWPRRARAATAARARRARRAARARAARHRLRRRRRTGRQGRAALNALESGNPAAWKALRGRGIFRGSGAPGKVAFLYTGQGSQYANMLAELRRDRADRRRRLRRGRRDHAAAARRAARCRTSSSSTRRRALAEAEAQLRAHRDHAARGADRRHRAHAPARPPTASSPTSSWATRSASTARWSPPASLSFEAALEAVSARGREMAEPRASRTRARWPPSWRRSTEVERDRRRRSTATSCSRTSTPPTRSCSAARPRRSSRAVALLVERGHDAIPLPVSHAFHTEIVAPASEPLRATLQRLDAVAAADPDRRQRRRRVLPVRARRRGADAGHPRRARSPRRCSSSRACTRSTTRARASSSRSVPSARCRASPPTCSGRRGAEPGHQPPEGGDSRRSTGAVRPVAAGLGSGSAASRRRRAERRDRSRSRRAAPAPRPRRRRRLGELGRLFAEFVERGRALMGAAASERATEPVVITGAAARAAGHRAAVRRRATSRACSHGEQVIDVDPGAAAPRDADKHITRLVKGDDGSARFETIDDPADVIKLAGARRRVRPRRGVRHRRRPPRGARARDAAGDRRRHRRAARRRHPARPALQGHDARAPAARPLAAARRAARRHRRDLRLRLPRPRATSPPRSTRSGPSASKRRARWRTLRARCSTHGDAGTRSRRGRPAHPRRSSATLEQRAVPASTAASCSACSPWATPSSPS